MEEPTPPSDEPVSPGAPVPDEQDVIPFADDEPPARPVPQVRLSRFHSGSQGGRQEPSVSAGSQVLPAIAGFDHPRAALAAPWQRPVRRPGVVTTLGVLSIIFGALGVVGSVVSMALIEGISSQANAPRKNPMGLPSEPHAKHQPVLEESTETEMHITTLVEIAASVYLVVCGISALNGWPKAGTAHLWYVWIKFALIVVGILLMQELVPQLEAARARPRGFGVPAEDPSIAIIFSSTSLIAGFIVEMIYPLAVLFMVRAKSAKAYFASMK